MTYKKVLKLCFFGILIAYALGIFLAHFAGSTGTAYYYTDEHGDQEWVVSKLTPMGLDFMSNLRVLWRLSGVLPPVGSQMFIYTKSPLEDSLVHAIETGELNLTPAGPPTPEDHFQQNIGLVQIGLPFRAFRYRVDAVKGANGEPKFIFHGALGISGKYIPGLESWRILTIPLMPAFPGFIVDVIFWGLFAWGMEYVIRGVLFVLKFILGINRRKLRATRRANNQCVPCGYPRGEFDTCPECGTAVEPLSMSEN